MPLHHSPILVPIWGVEPHSLALQASVITGPTRSAKFGGRGESRTPDFRLQAECVPASTTRPLGCPGILEIPPYRCHRPALFLLSYGHIGAKGRIVYRHRPAYRAGVLIELPWRYANCNFRSP